MNDCPNAVIRDQLPDLMHERLDASARAAVMAHVDACAECRAELEVLRGVLGMLVARGPRVDVASIVSALPKPPVVHQPRVAAQVSPSNGVAPRPIARRRVWSDWRVAAAVVLFVAGGSSVVLLRQAPKVPSAGDLPIEVTLPAPAPATTVTPASPAAVPANANSTQASVTPRQPAAAETVASAATAQSGTELGVSGHLADLDDGQLKALLDDIDRMQAVPITDPEPVTIKVDARIPASARGRGT